MAPHETLTKYPNPLQMETSAIIELSALIFGLTEALKRFLVFTASKFKISINEDEFRQYIAPLLAVLIGGGANIYLYGYSPENLVYGLTLGLAATGLYAAVKK